MRQRIYFNDLEWSIQQDIISDLKAELKEDADVMREINEQIDEDNETAEMTSETPQQREWLIDEELEERAEDIINRTFYGEITINQD